MRKLQHSVTKIFDWSMAHRLIHGYTGKCQNVHGHTYKAEITIAGNIKPDHFGMVIDFGHVSEFIKKWVMENLDHAMIVDADDESMIDFLSTNNQKMFVLPNRFVNSTAENISCLLGDILYTRLNQFKQNTAFLDLVVERVRVWETPTSCATWSLGGLNVED